MARSSWPARSSQMPNVVVADLGILELRLEAAGGMPPRRASAKAARAGTDGARHPRERKGGEDSGPVRRKAD